MNNRFKSAPYMEKAKELLSKMTLTEKIGQLVLYGSFKHNRLESLKEGKIGSFLNIPDVKTANEVQRIAGEESRLGIPLLIGHDVVHGDRTLFPVPLAGSASFDLEKIEKAEKTEKTENQEETETDGNAPEAETPAGDPGEGQEPDRG